MAFDKYGPGAPTAACDAPPPTTKLDHIGGTVQEIHKMLSDMTRIYSQLERIEERLARVMTEIGIR